MEDDEQENMVMDFIFQFIQVEDIMELVKNKKSNTDCSQSIVSVLIINFLDSLQYFILSYGEATINFLESNWMEQKDSKYFIMKFFDAEDFRGDQYLDPWLFRD